MLVTSFFRRLPDPLLSDAFSDAFERALLLEDDQSQIWAIRQLLAAHLSQLNYDALKFLTLHFEMIARNVKTTKMDAYNLAVVFAPHLFNNQIQHSNSNYAVPTELVAAAKKLQSRCHILYLLISRAPYVFGPPESLTQIPSLPNKFKTVHFQTLSSLL